AEAALQEAERERLRQGDELERRRLEAELAHAQRLESLGRLAAGMAHDYNNLLGVILNYAESAAREVDPGHRVAADIAHIRQAAEQASDVTRRLLVFGRRDGTHDELLDLNEIVMAVVDLVRVSLPHGVTV